MSDEVYTSSSTRGTRTGRCRPPACRGSAREGAASGGGRHKRGRRPSAGRTSVFEDQRALRGAKGKKKEKEGQKRAQHQAGSRQPAARAGTARRCPVTHRPRARRTAIPVQARVPRGGPATPGRSGGLAFTLDGERAVLARSVPWLRGLRGRTASIGGIIDGSMRWPSRIKVLPGSSQPSHAVPALCGASRAGGGSGERRRPDSFLPRVPGGPTPGGPTARGGGEKQ